MSTVRKHPWLLATLITGISLGLPSLAAAGGSPSPGVHVDPASPVAKEYALPLATARGAPADTGSTGSLFGSGITKHRSGPPPPTVTSTGVTSSTVTGSAPPESGSASPQTTPTSTPHTTAGALAPTPARTLTTPAPSSGPAADAHHRAPSNRAAAHQHRPATDSRAAGRRHSQSGTGALVGATVPAAMRIVHPGSGSSWLWMVSAACAVLAVGGAGALLLARVRRRQAS